ncbi:MAG: rRNA maturation RNase YbeY [Bacteroidetes bacterium]|nr:rRNA maturation RNase YbeY [Bacteroidota bacterium]
MPVELFNEHPGFSFDGNQKLEDFLLSIFHLEGLVQKVDLNLILLNDEDLLAYNKEYLQHDYYTDIITFLIEETETSLEAELYISLDRVKDNAGVLEQAFERELLRVFIHGVLHLCGYSDKSEEEELFMREKENYYLKLNDVSRETLFSIS